MYKNTEKYNYFPKFPAEVMENSAYAIREGGKLDRLNISESIRDEPAN